MIECIVVHDQEPPQPELAELGTANRSIRVQSKASERPFPGENDRTFHYLCRDSDVDYWMDVSLPFLYRALH